MSSEGTGVRGIANSHVEGFPGEGLFHLKYGAAEIVYKSWDTLETPRLDAVDCGIDIAK